MAFSEEHRERAFEKLRALRAEGKKPPANPSERFCMTKSAVGSKPYMRLAIAANCYECVGREQSYRRLIAECGIDGCALYSLRPYQGVGGESGAGETNE